MSELKKVIYDCRKATYLMDKKLIGKISFKESIELRIHLLGCDACRVYKAQSQKINTMIRQLLNTEPKPAIKLDESFKEQLQVRIVAQMDKN